MQKKIAEELELDLETMAMFDKQDEVDDFNGVDQDSRDVLRSVSTAIDQKLGHRKFIMIFLNGGKDEVDVSRFGINPEYRDHTIIWTFNRLYLTIREDHIEIKRKLRYTDIFVLVNRTANGLTSSEFCAVLREVAANIVARHPCTHNINLTMVMECCLYELFMQYSFHRATSFAWAAHAPNYWMCDGIIKEDGKKEICRSTLHQEIHWECDASRLDLVFEGLMKDPEAPFFIVKDDISFLEMRPCRWICVTSKDLVRIHVDIKTRFKMASSLFVALEESAKPPCLPNGFLKHCSNLCVLALSHCAFSFVSPPFLRCHKLRFLGLDHCSHDNTSEAEDNANWKCLQNLWVLDLRYTEWDDILSKEKMNIMANLREVNIEGYMCWQLIAIFHRRLLYLQRLRIIKPTHKAKTSTESSNSFMDKTELEILDLSGNRDMEKLSISSSMARSLLVLILDGCDGLEDVVVPDGLPSSLRLFSFDGYGPAARWMSSFELPLQSSERERPPNADKRVVKTSKISLQGCTQLENFFVRGLPNLVELDLSGSAIKVLDLTTMVVDVPGLKRLFLLGCEHLSAIKWGSYDSMKQLKLQLLCIDTRHRRVPGFTRPSLAQHKSFSLQLHATFADARLTRTLYELIDHYESRLYFGERYYYKGVYFNIQITSSIEYGGEMIQIQPSNRQHHVPVRGYGDVFSNIGDAPMLAFPQPPTERLGRHIEIGSGSRGLESALAEYNSLYALMEWHHLHLRSCPRLQFVLPVWVASFPSLETLHITHCGDLTHVFVLGGRYPQEIVTYGVPFPNLTTIHFHGLPKLQRIMCEVKMLAPALETVMIRGCFALRQLPSLQGRRRGAKRPTVEMEKDVWDALEWDGLAAGHHPDLFEPPVHSRYYRRRRLLRGTVLR
ncbi:unnamed protein product [Urochloa decumbens]|uniref:Uncharacterized protein n=1 Tax=Urochloa decumbens TaxID=240449 RepID=A0ABC9ELE9_9POAL